MINNKILIICGPTATGKTNLAIKLAKDFNGELVSADSRQVYKGMDIGTGKFLDKSKVKSQRSEIGYYEINNVRIWLYDIVEPSCQFNVADYKECAEIVIKNILQRNKLPILVGGTGLYIKAVIDNIETIGIKPNWELREKLSKYPINKLQNLLKELDPGKLGEMNNSDINNPRRLIRAIELSKQFKVKNKGSKINKDNSRFNPLFIGLNTSYGKIYQRIDQRVEERVKEGLEEEIKELMSKGYDFTNSALGTTIAYKEWQPYFQKKAELNDVIQKWKYNEHSYSRRQLTWFRKDKRINWFNIDDLNFDQEIARKIKFWLKQ